jgi:hypothetical protein
MSELRMEYSIAEYQRLGPEKFHEKHNAFLTLMNAYLKLDNERKWQRFVAGLGKPPCKDNE